MMHSIYFARVVLFVRIKRYLLAVVDISVEVLANQKLVLMRLQLVPFDPRTCLFLMVISKIT